MKKREIAKIVVVAIIIIVFILSYTAFFIPIGRPTPQPTQQYKGPASTPSDYKGPTGPPSITPPATSPNQQ